MTLKLTPEQTEALLEHLVARQNCANGCACVFCRTFDEGVRSGKQEAAFEFQNALENLKRSIGA